MFLVWKGCKCILLEYYFHFQIQKQLWLLQHKISERAYKYGKHMKCKNNLVENVKHGRNHYGGNETKNRHICGWIASITGALTDRLYVVVVLLVVAIFRRFSVTASANHTNSVCISLLQKFEFVTDDSTECWISFIVEIVARFVKSGHFVRQMSLQVNTFWFQMWITLIAIECVHCKKKKKCLITSLQLRFPGLCYQFYFQNTFCIQIQI